MFHRRAINTGSFNPLSFAFEIIDDGELVENMWGGVTLAAAHITQIEPPKVNVSTARRRKEEFAMMVLM